MIFIYKQRRTEYKKNKIKYAEKIRKLTYKISWMKKNLRLMEKNDMVKRVSKLLKLVNEYFVVDIKLRIREDKHILARNVYYKFGLESGLCGRKLCLLIGRTDPHRAYEGRASFTKSFKNKPENKIAFINFTRYHTEQKLTA
jgi:hypothetical protein